MARPRSLFRPPSPDRRRSGRRRSAPSPPCRAAGQGPRSGRRARPAAGRRSRPPGRADHVEPGERPARPGREAPAEDRAHVAFADVGQDALLEGAHRFQHLGHQQAVLHLGQLGLVCRLGELLAQTLPQKPALARLVIGVEARLGLAAHPALAGHPEEHLVHRAVGIGVAHRGLRGLGDLHAEVDRGLVDQLQRPERHAHELRRVLDQRGLHALADHADAFVDVGDDAAVGVEEARVVDHDRRLADLAHEVERLGHRAVAGFAAA